MTAADGTVKNQSTDTLESLRRLEERAGVLESECGRLRSSTTATRVMLTVLAIIPLIAAFTVRPDFSDRILDVRRLNIVDRHGVTRIQFGIETEPQVAIFYGRTFLSRGTPGAYARFFDDEGTEQGGISISDHGGISFGLDSRTGQNISLGTSADGRSASLRLWTVAGGERKSAAIGIFDGMPVIGLVRGGEVVLRLPRPARGDGSDEEQGNHDD